MRHCAVIAILAVAGLLLVACNPPADNSSDTGQQAQPASTGSGSTPGLGGPDVSAEPGGDSAEPAGESAGESGTPGPQRDTASLPQVPAKGKPLPTFEFATLDGKTHSVEEFVGQPLLINIWKINCPPCKAEMPEFVKLYGEYKDKGLEVITLNVEDTADAVKKFMETKQEMPWVTGFNAGTLARSWGVRGVPTSYFVNSDGVVVEIKLGAADRKYFNNLLPAWMGVKE
jgi:thiol-disulfide isomerase/thioredoxin